MQTSQIAHALSLSDLSKKAAGYFFRPVKCDIPFVYNVSGTGLIAGFEVVKKKKFYYLIKL